MADPHTTDAQETDPPRRRRVWRLLAMVGLGLVLVFTGMGGALYLRLSQGAMPLPNLVVARLETALDRVTEGGNLTLGAVLVEVVDDGAVQVVLRDVVVRDDDDRLIAALPLVETDVDEAALRRGTVKPTRVTLSGAGVVLRQRTDGTLNVRVSEDEDAPALALTEGLEWIDDVFDAAELDQLESVEGRSLTIVLARDGDPQTLRINDASMRLTRRDAFLTLTLGGTLDGQTAAPVDFALTRRAGAGQTDMAASFQDLAAGDLAQLVPALSWLDLVDAPIAGQLFTPLSDDGRVGDFSGQLTVGPGQFAIEGIGAPLSFEVLSLDTQYIASANRLTFRDLRLQAPELSFAATGHADLTADQTTYIGQFNLTDISANPRGVFPSQIDLDGAAVDLRLTLGDVTAFEIGHAILFDEGAEMVVQADVEASAAGVVAALDAHIAEIDGVQALTYWPEDLAANTRRWLSENVQDGTLQGADLALRLGADGDVRHELQFDFADAAVRAVRAMPPVTDGNGMLRLAQENLLVRLDSGQIAAPGANPVDVGGTTFAVPSTATRGPDAAIAVTAQGALTDVLTLLTLPPVNLFAEGEMTPTRAGTGQVTANADLNMRLLREVALSDVTLNVTGEVTDFASAGLVPDRLLEADRLSVAVTNESVRISGQARFDDVPVTGQWSRAIGPGADPSSRVEARATIDRDGLERLGIALPPGMVSGRGRADIDLTLTPGEPGQLRLRSDLGGLALAIPELGWRLGRDQSGMLTAEVELGPNPSVPSLILEAGGMSVTGRVELSEGGGFTRLVADRFRIGTWLDVEGTLSNRGAGAIPAIRVTGGVLDLRSMPRIEPGGGRGGAAPIDLTLDRLQVVDNIALTGVQAELSMEGGMNGRFGGRVNGRAPVQGTITPSPNGAAVRITSGDGGAVLRSANIFRTAYGGEMELILVPMAQRGQYDGQLSIQGPRLRDAPAMAELLNVISVVGLIEQLDGQGINLGEVDARFQILPDRVILSRGSAVGPSMGVSMDGTYLTGSRQIDMQGVISPFYAINGVLGVLVSPRREGLFGFAYRLQGVGDDTTVTVNPLSIFTPGVFREIFRRPPPELRRSE